MSEITIEDYADHSLFDRLLMLAERVHVDGTSDREVVEDYLNVRKHADRVYVKRRISNPDGEDLHEEGIFDGRKWQRVHAKMQKDNSVDVNTKIGVLVVPMSDVKMTVIDDPCEVAAIDAMSLHPIQLNAFGRMGKDADDSDSDAESGSDSDSDAESDAGSDSDSD